MGVQGLWPLLEPVGRRVNIEALTNKRLAVDASIWLVQFIKAMRNEKGEMLHNAHLLGFFRRICRLLFHRIRPVFVFDGATPALKKRTTIARRRRREEQSAKLRKTAEKLLLIQLKKHALKNMSGPQQAAVLQQAKQTSTADPTKSEEIPADLLAAAGSDVGNLPESSTSRPAIDLTAPASDQPSVPPSTAGDALLAAQLQEEDQEDTRLASNSLASTSGIHIIHGKPFTRRNSTFQGHLAPISSVDEVDMVMSKLLEDSKTASATHNILGYRVYDQSSGKVVQDFHDDGEGGAGIKIMHLLQDSNVRNVLVIVSRWFGGMLLGPARFMYITDAARGMLNQGGYLQQPKPLVPIASAPNAVPMEDTSSSEEEAEAVLPEGLDELDPAVLSTLPPSLQLEFALKLRERKQAENREHFQKHTGQPQAFSSFQLQQYLKGTQLKREVEKMKDAVNAAASGDGLPTRRIAGDAGREYILQTEDDTKAKAALDAEPSSRTLSSGRLEIEIEVPADHVDSHKPSPGGSNSSEEEWETVGAEGISGQLSPSENPDSTSKGRNWRERATHRQKYWSRMTGFQFGRKLGDWGKDEDPEAKASKELRASEVEDAELQQAIARSLQDTKQGASGDVDGGDSDVEWMDSEPMPESFPAPQEQDLGLPQSQDTQQGKSQSPAKASPQQSPQSQGPQAEQPASPITSPFKKVLSPWEKGNQHQPANQTSPSDGFNESSMQSLGKRKRVTDQPVDSEPAVDHLQHIIAGTDDMVKDQQRDSVLLDTLKDVPDDLAMPFSVEDRGVGLDDMAKANTKGSSPESQAPHAAQPKGSPMQEETEESNPEEIADITPGAGASGSLPVPSELGLGEYRSAGLDPGVSVGVSSTLPSFDLDAEMASLDKQTKRLQSQHRAQVRNADSPTSEMYGECQELLQMFGLPYIIAPMEAEAQCAWLDEAKLVDGVVTDDNDVFLFGGQHVYRNIFEGKKYVEEYRVQDVESELGMSRDKLIQLALLLGSDYTEGVAGIGIVNAVEIVNAFPTEELLVNFRKWVLTPDAQLITALGGTEDVDPDQHIRAFKHTHTGLRKNWDVPETFPNTAVIKAYKDAKVDQNKDKFTYGRPDLQLLRRFCLDKFGWQQDRADELLVPVLKAYDDNQTQMTLDSFLSFSQRFAKIKSRRLQKAVAGITGVANSEMTFGDEIQDPAPKRRKAGRKGKVAQQEEDAGGASCPAHKENLVLASLMTAH
ncbi:hypothetical protein WJX79_006455 [Trebouxia sp. C0005]